MADTSDDDPYLTLGRQITSGQTSGSAPTTGAPATTDDPYLKRGQEITQPLRDVITSDTASKADIPGGGGEQPSGLTLRGTVRNIAAVPLDVGANLLNLARDPAGNILSPVLAAGGSVYDFAAPYFGAPRLTPEQRADLAGNDPYASRPGTTIENALIGNVGGTPQEQTLRNALGAGATAAYLGPYGATPVLTGLGASLGGQTAASAVPEWAQPAAELLGNVAGAKVASGAANIGARVAGAVTGATTPLGEAYDRLGIDRTLMGDVSDSQFAKQVQSYASQSPGGAGAIQPKMQKAVDQFSNAVEDTANRLGQSSTAQAAGDVLQSEARNWKDTVFPAQEQAAWAPVDRAMATATVDPTNYRSALSALTAKLSALPETQKQLLPPKTQALLDAINVDVPPGQTMTWQQAQNLRSAIGNVMGVPEIVQSVGKDQLKAAYGGISQDMKASAAANNALPLFDAANKVSTDGHAFIDNTLSKIVKANNPAQETITPEQAAKTVIGSGDTTLQAIRAEMPRAADELAAWKLRDMRLATPGQAGATGAEPSVGSFLTDLNRLKQSSPNGFRALYSDPTVAQRLDDLATTGASMKDTARRLNFSNTAASLALQAGLAAVPGIMAFGPKGAAAAVAPLVGNYLAARAVSSPMLTRVASAPGPRATINPLAAALIANMQDRRNALTPP